MDKYAAMTTVEDIQERLEQIDLQILRLLGDRKKVYDQMGDVSPSEADAETPSLWVEEAGEMGLDENYAEKMSKVAIAICKRAE